MQFSSAFRPTFYIRDPQDVSHYVRVPHDQIRRIKLVIHEEAMQQRVSMFSGHAISIDGIDAMEREGFPILFLHDPDTGGFVDTTYHEVSTTPSDTLVKDFLSRTMGMRTTSSKARGDGLMVIFLKRTG